MMKWLFFDLGSTLIDESDCDEFRLQELLCKSNVPGREEVLKTMREFASKNLSAYQKTVEFYGLQTTPWPVHLEKLYPQVPELLENLQQKYHLGIIANQNAGTEDRLQQFGIREYFSLIAASGELGIAKPDLRIFEFAVQQAQCQPEEAIMIGDRLDNDIEPAGNLGMRTIWVKQGMGKFGSVGLLSAKPSYTVENISEILAIL